MSEPENRYPHTAGHRGVDTSIASAEAITPKVKCYREVVFESLADDGPATSWELAERLDIEFPVIQPRTSELKKLGRIEDSGERKPTRFGKKSIVWRVKEETANA